eukprot:TRINITY_DN17040_c0_g1_i2.p1 TRINITY_DN17040_c0_g1~~TRINITY_DN17040_c0_g1_i2.p1  ORF type:complete len:1109 (+),score=221.83 TRINITY_DN17040_c0_g1_i2:50-3376(+)
MMMSAKPDSVQPSSPSDSQGGDYSSVSRRSSDEEQAISDDKSWGSGSEDGGESEISDLGAEEEVDLEIDDGDSQGILKDLMVQHASAPPDPTYHGNWDGAPAPGSDGFNHFAARVMLNARVGQERAPSPDHIGCPPLQPHQETVAFLLHPQSPVSRLLVDHPTGSGKTREMIRVLDNYFFDARPKVPIFPKEPVCRNFYVELLRWPSRYRDFFACLRPQDAALAAGVQDWRVRRAELWDVSEMPSEALKEICANLRDVLEMKGWFFMGEMRRSRRDAFESRFPEEAIPGAPLRALRYTSAGGRHAELRDDGLPVSALLKVAFDRATAGGNAYSNKVVIMDEVHNLVRVQTQYGEQLERLRALLSGARGTVLAGFTGTPILNEAAEGRQLLDIIKGKSAPQCDDGFLSSFHLRPAGLFPSSLPRGIPDSVLSPNLRRQFVRHVKLTAEPLKRYDAKRQEGLPGRRLRNYCNLCVHFGSFHGGKSGSKARVLADVAGCAPKLHAIAKDVAEIPLKALVLITRNSGLEVLLEHLRGLASQAGFNVATMEELAEFNSPGNLRGERYRVLVADAAQCSEGVSFFAVRRLHLADVPSTPSALVQSVGRAIRMYGHKGLPREEQTVTSLLWVAGFPRWMRSPLGAWAFRAQRGRGEAQDMESGARRLLRRLMAAGVQDFDALKAKLDACGGGSIDPATGHKAPMTSKAAASFFEQVGFWDEAKALRQRVQKGADQPRTRRFREQGLEISKVIVPKAHPAVKQEDLVKSEIKLEDGKPQVKVDDVKMKQEVPETCTLRRLRKKTKAVAKAVTHPECAGEVKDQAADCMDADGTAGPFAPRLALPSDGLAPASLVAPIASKKQASQDKAPKKSSASLRSELAWERDPLVRAMQGVYCAASADEAQNKLFLSTRSADEEALQTLACQSQKIVPALAQLRSKAVDRAILMGGERHEDGQVVQEEDEHADSDGESSAMEFGVSDSDGDGNDDGAVRIKERPALVLPQDWRTEMFRRKGRECREFVGPTGRRYRTMPEARRVINLQRTRENMVQKLRSKYATATRKVPDTTPEKVKRPSHFAKENPLIQCELKPSSMEVDNCLAVAQETEVPESSKRLRKA